MENIQNSNEVLSANSHKLSNVLSLDDFKNLSNDQILYMFRQGYRLNDSDKQQQINQLSNLPSVSVHCLTFGRPWNLEEAIESFIRQDYAGKKEMVILNDLQEQELFFDHPDVKIINTKSIYPTIGDARNALINYQNADIIITLDDDDILLPNYISTCVQLLGDLDWVFPQYRLILYRHTGEMIRSKEGGTRITFRKSVWQKVKGFSSINFGEDWDFVYKLKGAENIVKGKLITTDDIPNIGYIDCMYENGTYHTSRIQDIPGGKSRLETKRDLILRDIEYKRLPSGKIQLFPNWKQDYVRMFERMKKT